MGNGGCHKGRQQQKWHNCNRQQQWWCNGRQEGGAIMMAIAMNGSGSNKRRQWWRHNWDGERHWKCNQRGCATLLFVPAGCCVTLLPPLPLNASASCNLASHYATLLLTPPDCPITSHYATATQRIVWLSRCLLLCCHLVCPGWLLHHPSTPLPSPIAAIPLSIVLLLQ
jgi:hypothetical protein